MMSEEHKIVARLSVLSNVQEIIETTTPQNAYEKMKELASLVTRAIDHEVFLLGSSTGYDLLYPIANKPPIEKET